MQYAAFNAASEIKAGAALLHGGTIGLRGLYRNGAAYVLAPVNGQYPMGSAAVDPASATELYGADVGRFLATGSIVLSATSAGLFGATVGDVAEVRRWSDGGLTRLTIVGDRAGRAAAGGDGAADLVRGRHRLRAPDQRPDLRVQVGQGGR